MSINFYTTHCPKCTVLEKKLNSKRVQYNMITDVELMQSKGFVSMPMLEIDGKIMGFGEAVKWVNQLNEVKE